MTGAPRRLGPDDPALPEVLDLLRRAFAGMEGRIDPPSSLHRMDLATLRETARGAEVWAIGAPVLACVTLTPKADALYLGKLAVDGGARGTGLARRLVDHAARRATELGLPALELQTRIELVENHATFRRLDFEVTAETRHPGYDRTTSLTMRRPLPRGKF